jgi:hypothetical protein
LFNRKGNRSKGKLMTAQVDELDLDEFDVDVRMEELPDILVNYPKADVPGFTSIGSSCWSCNNTCYSNCCTGNTANKFCSLACSC